MRVEECFPDSLLRFVRGSRPWFALVWLPLLLLAPVVSAAGRGGSSAVASLLALAGFAVLFCGAVVLPARRPRWWSETTVTLLVLVAVGCIVLDQETQRFLYPLIAIAMALGIRAPAALSFVASLAISGAITAGLTTGSLADALFFGFAALMAGATTYLIRLLALTLAELTASRHQLAAAAVNHERDRLTRDLHDLLGHTLSVIVVKAEAVRRLAKVDHDAVVEHARGIESVGRDALAQVREAVCGDRDTSLRDELAGAAEALTSAGVRADLPTAPDLPPDVDRVLGWLVREGTTNVLRHARASRCVIGIDADADGVTLEILDDGQPGRPLIPGTGLAGLRHRVEALDGMLVAEATADGFRLSASVPLAEEMR